MIKLIKSSNNRTNTAHLRTSPYTIWWSILFVACCRCFELICVCWTCSSLVCCERDIAWCCFLYTRSTIFLAYTWVRFLVYHWGRCKTRAESTLAEWQARAKLHRKGLGEECWQYSIPVLCILLWSIFSCSIPECHCGQETELTFQEAGINWPGDQVLKMW